MKKGLAIVVLFITAFRFEPKAEVYTVNDVQQFNLLMTKIKAGDIIVWKNGSYTDIKIDFTPIADGTSKNQIILKAESPGKVSFSGNAQICIGGTYLQVQGFLFEGNCTLNNNENVIDFSSSSKNCFS
ncbi:MAG: chondroitinase-B domain-containing protein [Ferruginibacter sp.]